ncbi:hypothetical protein EKD16_23385 [Streptomonospora litoralis]|uniref:Histidine kinase/HSP90-like ATPase domain-containing protein n=1 Tax=Streptomonospora litoralis TaxID=2498135 RepID=A0A4P6Q6N0_9ACTN|nr:hypothetical protein EKD16_23385 [Streptomonospora litoralis]
MPYCPTATLTTVTRRTYRRPGLSADAAEVPAARSWIVRTLAPTDRGDGIVLVADELLANALQHAPAPAGGVVAVLAVEQSPHQHEVRVRSRPAPTVPAARRPNCATSRTAWRVDRQVGRQDQPRAGYLIRRAPARLAASCSRVWWECESQAGWPGSLRQDSLSGLLSTVSNPNSSYRCVTSSTASA